MAFPWVAVAPPAELPVGAFDAPAVVAGSVLAGAGEADPGSGWCRCRGGFDGAAVAAAPSLAGTGGDGPEAGGVAAEPADVPPKLVT